MKKVCNLAFLLISLTIFSQEIPEISLKKLDGTTFNTKVLNDSIQKPIVVSFWATWCIPCINELSAIHENIEDWKSEAQFDFYAISTDDARSSKKAKALVDGKGWEYIVLLDDNQDFKRALNIANIPYLLIIKNGKIIHKSQGYTPGKEEEILQILKDNQ